ncbi:MAG: InlB B-repeat-containing protein [Clostridia bacterium]|nr:InlB B-repeat-containing protein [Clostridia bacterium]
MRTGYDFLGWAEEQGSTTVVYAQTADIVMNVEGGMTLYAVWSRTVNASFGYMDADGAAVTASASYTYYNGDTSIAAEIPEAPAAVVLDGVSLTFTGWALTDALAADASVPLTGTVTIDADAAFYAVYTVAASVTFDANGGQDAPEAISETLAFNWDGSSRDSITLPETFPTRETYDLVGWSLDSASHTAAYQPRDVVDFTGDVELFAIWHKNVAIDFHYMTASGEVISTGMNADFYNDDVTGEIDIPAAEANVVRDGRAYTLIGWALSPVAEASIGTTGVVEVSTTEQYYAVYESDLVVTFTGNGGEPASATQTETVAFNYDGSVAADFDLDDAIPAKEGYDFIGWALPADDRSVVYAAGATVNALDDFELVAVWNKTVTATFNFMDADGSLTSVTADGILVNDDATVAIDIPEVLASAVLNGRTYTLAAWSADSSATAGEFAIDGAVVIGEDSDFYATYTAPVVVTFDANGGSPDATQTATVGFCYDASVAADFILSTDAPANGDYSFMGWALPEDDETVVYAPGDSVNSVADFTLTAVWNKTVTATVYYTAADGTAASAVSDGVLVNDDASVAVALPEIDAQAVIDGRTYTLVGFASSGDAVEAELAIDATVDLSADAVYYAVYNSDIVVTFVGNGGEPETATQTETVGFSYDAKNVASFDLSEEEPYRRGWTFDGWAEDGSDEVSVLPGDVITAFDDFTLTAVWQINYYLVSFIDMYGFSLKDEMIAFGSAATAPDITLYYQIDADTHHAFTGWDTAFDCIEDETVVNSIYVVEAHSIVPIPDIEPTCSSYGYASGFECECCHEITTQPTELQKTAHVDADGDYRCDVCGEKLEEYQDANLCEYCGNVHQRTMFGIIIRIVHKIMHFVSELFAR